MHPDFYLGHVALSADASGALVYLYDGATTTGGKQTISAKRSTDHGTTWSAPTIVSTVGEEATLPMVESRGSGDVRIAWMETSGGGNVDAWNAFHAQFDGWRRDLVIAACGLGCDVGRGVQDRGWLCGDLRRLR